MTPGAAKNRLYLKEAHRTWGAKGEAFTGHLGFSFVGLLSLCMLIVPSLLWARSRPLGYGPSGENRILAALEKAGQAGATLPVLAFLLLGIYGRVIWLILCALVLGVGHIGTRWQHRKAL